MKLRLPLLLLGVAVACARAPQPGALTPFRRGAALAATGRCDSATVVARAALEREPDNALGPLVIGACQERAGRYDEAVATYTDFAAQHPNARGVPTLRAKAQLALRAAAEHTARQALAREAELANQPPQPATVAVLPLVVAGDSTVQPLSRGLAELITTDLAYIRTLRLLERLQIGMLLDELKLGQSERVDPATAARVGRLLRAERLVQGTATIPSRGPVQLSATVVTGSGVVRPVGQVSGPFPKLLLQPWTRGDGSRGLRRGGAPLPQCGASRPKLPGRPRRAADGDRGSGCRAGHGWGDRNRAGRRRAGDRRRRADEPR